MTQFTEQSGQRIAYTAYGGKQPTVFYLSGHRNVMGKGHKSIPLQEFIVRELGHSFIEFDYSGWGESGHSQAEWQVEQWLLDALAVFDATVTEKAVLVGYSMGGFLMLALAMLRPEKVSELVGINAGFGNFIENTGKSSIDYGSEPLIYLSMDAGFNCHRIDNSLPIQCPINLVVGASDNLVPWQTSQIIMEQCQSDDISLTMVKNATHRLDQEHEMRIVYNTIREIIS